MLLAKRSLNNWLNHNIFVVDFAVEILWTVFFYFAVFRCAAVVVAARWTNRNIHLIFMISEFLYSINFLDCNRCNLLMLENWVSDYLNAINSLCCQIQRFFVVGKMKWWKSYTSNWFRMRKILFFAFSCRSVRGRWFCCCYWCSLFSFYLSLEFLIHFVFVRFVQVCIVCGVRV